MLTAVERVLILKGADLLREVGPRHLLELADVARELEFSVGDAIYAEQDVADALYMVVEGRIRLWAGGKPIAEVGPGEAFGTWALVDDSARGQRAECCESGMALALHREAFYDVAAGDLALLREIVRALAKRLRALVSERPEEARVEGEGIEKPEAMLAPEASTAVPAAAPADAPAATPGEVLVAAVLGQPAPDTAIARAAKPTAIPTAESERAVPVPGPVPAAVEVPDTPAA